MAAAEQLLRMEAAQRLFRAGQPILGTPAEAYLRARGITAVDFPALRFHPSVFYRADEDAPLRRLPAMLAAITNLDGRLVGVNRTWLDVEHCALAELDAPRKVLGVLLGHGVRFGDASDRLLAGEGIETVLSLKSVLPGLPMVAALTANHLAALLLPAGLGQLVIARDNDDAGLRAAVRLRARAEAQGVAVDDLVPCLGDFNDDLRRLSPTALARNVRDQLAALLPPAA
ncbi:MAG: toprim domain-containing protein [Kiloniellales bacterium]